MMKPRPEAVPMRPMALEGTANTVARLNPTKSVTTILAQVLEGRAPGRDDLERLLAIRDPRELGMLFQTARRLRRRHFDARVFLYGFLYFSTHCRNNCTFCQFRRDHTDLRRYRKSEQELVAAATTLADSGIHLVDMTSGEDPGLLRPDGEGTERLFDSIRAVKRATGLPLMASPGVVSDATLARLAAEGVDWYACYQETHQRRLFKTLRPGQNYDVRLNGKLRAKSRGMFIEEGILCGVGETLGDIADSILMMHAMDADQVRVMRFVPQQGTPLSGLRERDAQRELVTMAVMRLIFPDRLIPASLDVDGLAGLKDRLDAGANVVTSLIPPGIGLAGVANRSLDIEEARRTTAGVGAVLDSCGLQPATPAEYQAWLALRRQRQGRFQHDNICAA